MMDNIKDTISNMTKSVYRTSKGFLKTTKLSMDLASEESNLKAIYLEIGKKVHEIYAYGGSLGKFFDEKYKELVECEQKLDTIRRNLDEAKGTRTCPKCGKTAAATAEFCPKCGTKMDESSENVAFQSRDSYSHKPPYNPGYAAPPPYSPDPGYTAAPPAHGPDPGYAVAPPPYGPDPGYAVAPPAYGPDPGYAAAPPAYGPDPGYAAAPPPYTAEEAPAASAPDSKQCPVCGKNNAAGNKFCFSCGRLL
ncbi:MAG: zinc-ribbon domain-containing protein [Clostridiales bacterium]|nr:zinc-ribbon domain-containing protein [Clostridiales bacterium]